MDQKIDTLSVSNLSSKTVVYIFWDELAEKPIDIENFVFSVKQYVHSTAKSSIINICCFLDTGLNKKTTQILAENNIIINHIRQIKNKMKEKLYLHAGKLLTQTQADHCIIVGELNSIDFTKKSQK